MAMTVGGVHNPVSAYNKITAASQNTLQRIASGSRLPGVSLGASDYAIAVRLASDNRAASQSIRNTQNISSAIKISAGATDNTINGLQKIREQLISAANDTNGSLDRKALQKNINELVSQIDSNAYVQYNGMNLLDGSRNGLMLAGIDGYENFPAGDLRSNTLGLTDSQGNVTIDASTAEAANNSLKIVDNALTSVGQVADSLQFMNNYVAEGLSLDEATTQGAQLQRLQFQEANYRTIEENQQQALSNISDSDIATQTANLQSEQLQQQMALFATMMFNQSSARILALLA